MGKKKGDTEQGLHLEDKQLQYIARISHGKDSLKMLDVIVSRGLPLDRITTTDVWATDTIRGEHPKMVAFKEQADEFIWRKYHIEVEHLCAMRNGEKVTYCHPYSSYERGTNENLNKMLRRIFPKGTDFDLVPDEEIIAAAGWMNNYPRKVLGGTTAAHAFDNFLAEIS